jgi:uncharacterized protein
LCNNPNRPFYKNGKHFPLRKIEPEELGVFAKKKYLAGGIEVAENEINEILNISECHPYYFQMLFHVFWEICQSEGS